MRPETLKKLVLILIISSMTGLDLSVRRSDADCVEIVASVHVCR